MRIPRIYQDAPMQVGNTLSLDPRAANHVVRVLRLKENAPLVLFNGQGGEFEAQLSSVTKQSADVILTAHHAIEKESPLTIHLAQSISRGEKMDFVIQKAVELGVASITPLFTERSTVQLDGDRLTKRWQHWQGVAVSACEQCGRNRIPVIEKPITYSQWLSQTSVTTSIDTIHLVLHHRAQKKLVELPATIRQATLLIGGEGGLSEPEIEQALARGFIGMTLGSRVLRTETAPMAALAVLQARWGDF